MAITITTLQGTNSLSADRITINDNFKINTDAINNILGVVDTTIGLIDKLLTLSNKYLGEGQNVVAELEKATKDDLEEDFAKTMKKQLVALNEKQRAIHERVEEIQQMLLEMYNVDEDDTF